MGRKYGWPDLDDPEEEPERPVALPSWSLGGLLILMSVTWSVASFVALLGWAVIKVVVG